MIASSKTNFGRPLIFSLLNKKAAEPMTVFSRRFMQIAAVSAAACFMFVAPSQQALAAATAQAKSVVSPPSTNALVDPLIGVDVKYYPDKTVAGEKFKVIWKVTGADIIHYDCFPAAPGGFATSGDVGPSGTIEYTALAQWVGSYSTCVWYGENSETGGITQKSYVVSTIAPPPPPTITSIIRNPETMVAGQPFTITWTAANAIKVQRDCFSSSTGFVVHQSLPSSGSQSGTASFDWVGFDSQCTWVAANDSGGWSAHYLETMKTNPPPPLIAVQRMPKVMKANEPYMLTWSTQHAVSVNRVCTSTGSGFASNGPMTVQGLENGTAAAEWADYPSTCTWTATNSAGVATVTSETMTTIPPAPTITVKRTPSLMTANQPYTLTWSTTDAVSLNRACSSTGSGFTSNGRMNLQGPENGTAAAHWADNPSTCTWTATNSAGVATAATETMTTIPPAPTITVKRTPSLMTANQPYTLTWSTTDAVSVNRLCTSTGSGFTSNGRMSLQGPENGTAAAHWVNNPSTCTWTATNSAGVATITSETMTTRPPDPTITVKRTPSLMTANQPYTLTWSTTDAVSVNRVCTSTGSGFTSNGAMNLQGPENGTAAAHWADNPSTCTWTVTNSAGVATAATETMTTIPPAPTITVKRTPSLMTANQPYTLTWSTTAAVSVNRVCTSTGLGFTSNGPMTLQGPENGTAAAGWADYPSTCVWTATNSAGAATYTEPMTTKAAAPTITVVKRVPATMTAGQPFTLEWGSANATSVSRICTSSGTGFVVDEQLGASGKVTGTALPDWVGHGSTCKWVAKNSSGSSEALVEVMNTLAAFDPSVTYIHTDGLGSPVARTDSLGNVLSVTQYEPYGLTASGEEPTIGFTGHAKDFETGLTYMQQRYYDPVAGRFLSIDPVTTDANTGKSFNRYNYANNNPYKYIDPDGRDPEGNSSYGAGVALGAWLTDMSASDVERWKGGERAAGASGANAIRGFEGMQGLVETVRTGKINIAPVTVTRGLSKLPKPPTGRGSVAPADRDPKRVFSRTSVDSKLKQGGGNCEGCSNPLSLEDAKGHHKDRHADGGKTDDKNLSVLCETCHKEIHKPEK